HRRPDMHTRFWFVTGAAIALALGVAATAASADTPPPPGRAPVPGASTPKLGEYVYVEELPEVIHRTDPEIPDVGPRVEGTVTVQALVGTDGLVHDTQVTKSVPLLDEAAVACVRQWVLKPALSNQKPVAVWV